MSDLGQLFISYRRNPDVASAGRLADSIRTSYPEYQIFMDVTSLDPGDDFPKKLELAIQQCTVFLVVIGQGWADVRDSKGQRRLDNENDFVRREIEMALRHGKQIVPILIGDAKLPSPIELPTSLRRLLDCNATSLRHERFSDDCSALMSRLQPWLRKKDDGAEAAFADESTVSRRIVRERKPGWEYRLAAELLSNYLKQPLRRWKDLAADVFSPRKQHLDEEETLKWFSQCASDSAEIFGPLTRMTPMLLQAFGPPGEPGDAEEILHVCQLFGHAVRKAVSWEEQIHSVKVPEKFSRLYSFLPGLIGSQIEKLCTIPPGLNEVARWIEEHSDRPKTFTLEIVFEVPTGWERKVQAEIERLTRQVR